MKEYTPEALGIIGEYYENLTLNYTDIFGWLEQELHIFDFIELEDIAYEMMVGRHDDCGLYDQKYHSDTSAQLFDYEHILPYAKDLGIQLNDAYERICEEGGYEADCIIEKLLELVTDALLQGIKDNWEYLTSDEY